MSVSFLGTVIGFFTILALLGFVDFLRIVLVCWLIVVRVFVVVVNRCVVVLVVGLFVVRVVVVIRVIVGSVVPVVWVDDRSVKIGQRAGVDDCSTIGVMKDRRSGKRRCRCTANKAGRSGSLPVTRPQV